MKKIILLLLIAQVRANICAVAESQFEETCKIHNEFEELLKTNNFEKIEKFIKKNIDFINARGMHSETMLRMVSFKVADHDIEDDFGFKVIKLMLQLGANVLHQYASSRTIFHDTPDLIIKAVEAIEEEREELNQILLNESQMPQEIIDIIKSYHSEKQAQLMDHAILNSKFNGCTPLHNMANLSHSRSEGIKLLVKYKADLEAKDLKQLTPIFYAVIGYTRILKLLIELGANINIETRYLDSTPLAYAIKYRRYDSAEILRKALKQKQVDKEL